MRTRRAPRPAHAICIGAALAVAVTLPCALAVGQAEAKTTTKKLTMTVGKSKTVKVKVAKKVKKATWKTSKKKVVAIKASGSKKAKCKLTAKKAGTATITAKVGKNKYQWKVTVKKKAAKTTTPATDTNTAGNNSSSTDNTGGSTNAGNGGGTTDNSGATGNTGGATDNSGAGSTAGGTTDTGNTTGGTTDETGGSTVETTSSVVKWTATSETFTGAYANQDETTGQTDIIPKTLTRKYVSFDPWPTTDAQVQYVIKNCDDPYVVAALYVVALDNYTFTTRGVYTHEYYKMLNSLMSGAGTLSGSNYALTNNAKQTLEEFHNKQVVDNTGAAVYCSTFAARAYLAGATPYNGYTPTGGLTDKTKWQIVMDEYAYCGDLANGYITVCPQRYSEEQATEGSQKVHTEHWQGIRIGMMKNNSANLWIPCLNTTLNSGKPSTLTPFNVEKQVLFSSNYIAPQVSQGF